MCPKEKANNLTI